jgi:hypothetical protein
MSNTDQYRNGSKVYMRNTEVTSYNAIKTILKAEGFDSVSNTTVRLPLSEMFDATNWGDDVNPNIIYWDNTDNLYSLKVQYHDTSSIPVGALTAGDVLTYFDKIGGGAGGSAAASNLALGVVTATTQSITNSNGTGFTLPSATPTTAGLLSSADKVIIDSLATGAGESALIGNGNTLAIPTPNAANWKLNTVYVFNADSTLTTPITLANGSVLTNVENGSSLKMVKTGPSTYAYTLNDAVDTASVALITTATTLTGILTPAQNTALPIGLSKNATTGEVWQKTTDGIVTKIEDLKSICVLSPATNIVANGSYIFNHNLNDLNPIIQGYDGAGVVLVNQPNIAFTIVDANNVKVEIGSVPETGLKIKVCGGAMVTYSGGGSGTLPAFTPIVDDSTHLAITSTTYQGAIDQLSTIARVNRENISQTIHFGFAVGQAIAGNHFNKSSDEMWFYNPVNPGGTANGRYIFLKMDEGTSPATPLIVKIIRKKRDGTDYVTPYHTFTIPASATSTVPFEIVNQLGFTPILEGEVLYVNLSASAPLIGLTIGLTYLNIF